MKKIFALLIGIIMVFSSVGGFAYSVKDAFDDFKEKHPTFVTEVAGQGVTEATMISFLGDVSNYMKEMQRSEAITEANFEAKAITAITRVSAREKYISLQDALIALYPADIGEAVQNNKVTEKFKPLVSTVKKIIFDNNILDTGSSGSGSIGGSTKPSTNPEQKPEDNPEEQTKFTDIDTSFWAYTAITALSEKFIINGYLDNTFKANENITRAEFAKIIVTATGEFDHTLKCDFTDVKEDDWFYPYVASAMNKGYITGYPDKTFRPNEKITRQDICTVVYRCVKDNLKPRADTSVFTDADDIASYANEAVHALNANGIVNGMGNGAFNPKNHATRAQTAKIIYSAFFE